MLKFGGANTARQAQLLPGKPPTFSGTVPDATLDNGAAIESILVPAATGGGGTTYTYAASGLSPGPVFDADGTGACEAARTVCGAHGGRRVRGDGGCHDADLNVSAADRTTLTVTLTVETAITIAVNPGALTEANLHGATLTVTLTGTRFASGVSAASFTLVTTTTSVDGPAQRFAPTARSVSSGGSATATDDGRTCACMHI